MAQKAPNYNQVRIDPDLYPTIAALAKEDDRSITKQVNRLLRQALGGLQPLVPPTKQEVVNAAKNMEVEGAKLNAPMPKKIASEPSAQKDDSFAPISETDIASPSPDGGASNEGQEQPCCSNPNPCKHWTWDGNNQVWKNTLSGREKSNE